MYDYFELLYAIDELEEQYRIAQETVASISLEEVQIIKEER